MYTTEPPGVSQVRRVTGVISKGRGGFGTKTNFARSKVHASQRETKWGARVVYFFKRGPDTVVDHTRSLDQSQEEKRRPKIEPWGILKGMGYSFRPQKPSHPLSPAIENHFL